jgi:general secretion pathway protein C
MQDLIKRYFWVLGVLAVVLCAVFAAKATGAIIEANLLGDAKQGPKIQPPVRPDLTAAKPVRSKDGIQLATRNIFCSECTPPVAPVNTDPQAISLTTLPLQLLATSVSSAEEESSATIINTDSQMQGAFSVGDKVPGASGSITAIHYKFVDFENNGRIERLALQGAAVNTTPVATAAPVASNDENKDELQAAIDGGIRKIDDNTYEIEKQLVDKVLLNPMAVVKGARVVPAMKNGKPDGFKLYAIRPSSAFAKLGLTNGDTLTSINGFELNTADKALEVYTKLREATSLELEVTRRGKPVTLKYTIR